MSVSGDILRSWRRPGSVMRSLLAQGQREDRALVYLMVACGLIFLGQWPRLIRLSQEGSDVPLQALLGGALMGWMFIAPLLAYGLAGLLRLMMVALRRPVDWYAARLALFWALLAASPLWMAQGAVAGYAGQGPLTALVGFVALAAFFWILVAALGTAALEARQGSA